MYNIAHQNMYIAPSRWSIYYFIENEAYTIFLHVLRMNYIILFFTTKYLVHDTKKSIYYYKLQYID